MKWRSKREPKTCSRSNSSWNSGNRMNHALNGVIAFERFWDSKDISQLFLSVPTSYEDSLKPSSVIIPTSVLERDAEKYSNNNHLALSDASPNSIALKTEDVSNDTSNLMVEDRQSSTATRWGSYFQTFAWKIFKLLSPNLHLQFDGSINDKFGEKWK